MDLRQTIKKHGVLRDATTGNLIFDSYLTIRLGSGIVLHQFLAPGKQVGREEWYVEDLKPCKR